MKTISAILDPDPDGSLHLPLPEDLRHGKVKIEARLEAAQTLKKRAMSGLWRDLPGPFRMSPDFDEPLDDFREYME